MITQRRWYLRAKAGAVPGVRVCGIIRNGIDRGIKPSREYLRHLLKGCDLLSEDYCKKLKKIETID